MSLESGTEHRSAAPAAGTPGTSGGPGTPGRFGASGTPGTPGSVRAPGAALRDVLALLALTGTLWLVHVFGRTLPTPAAAVVWAALGALVALGLYRRARMRRAVFLTAYVRGGSPLARRLRGGPLMAARAGLLGAALGLVLLAALIRLGDPYAWVVLVASAPALVLAQRVLGRVLAPHASAEFGPELVWRAAAAVVGAAMLAALVALAFYSAQPELGGVTLERAVWHFVDAERARSAWVEALLQGAAVQDGLRLWLAQQLMPVPGTSLVHALGWLIVLAEEALFVWSYLLVCSAVLVGVRRHDGDGTAR